MFKRLFVVLSIVAFGLMFALPVTAQVPGANPSKIKPASKPPVVKLTDTQQEPATQAPAEPKLEKPATEKPTKEEPVEDPPVVVKRRLSEDLLPAATKAWISIPDADALDEAFHQTQLGKLAKEETLKPFADHLKGEAKKWINDQNVRLNLNVDDLHGVHSGEICFAGVLPEDEEGQPISGRHGLVFLMDVSETEQKAVELQTKINAELVSRGAVQQVLTINGVEYTKSVIDKPKIFRKKRYNFQAIVNGWMLVSNNEAVFRDVVGRLAKPANIQPVQTLGAQKSFQTVQNNTQLDDYTPHIRWFVDPFGYLQLAQQIKDDEAIAKVARDDVALKLKNNGFHAFRGIGGNVAVNTDEHEVIHRTFTYSVRNKTVGNKRFYDLFDFTTPKKPLNVPTWVPTNASSILIGNWNYDRALEGVSHFYDVWLGEPDGFKRMLHDFKIDPALQLDVPKLVGMLDDQLIIISATEKPISSESERVVVGIPINGDEDFIRESMHRAQPGSKIINLGGFKVVEVDTTEEAEDGGGGIDIPFDIPDDEEEEEEPAQPRFELFEKRYFIPVNSYLLVSNNKNFLRKVLAQQQSKLETSSDFVQVKQALSKLTDDDKVCWRHFGRLEKSLEINYEMLRNGEMGNAQTVLARIINQIAAKNRADEALAQGKAVDPDAVREQKLDGSKLPEDFATSIAPYLGVLGSVMEAEDEGWRITGCLLKKKTVTEVVQKIEEKDTSPKSIDR
ncbi:MAG: hypothetical protein AAFN77_18575 [Planctomycetota bacterium]